MQRYFQSRQVALAALAAMLSHIGLLALALN